MNGDREVGRGLLPVLIGGVAILIALLAASAYVIIGDMRTAESSATSQFRSGLATMRLLDDVHRQEDSLNAVFYGLAIRDSRGESADLLGQLDTLRGAVARTAAAGSDSGNSAAWRQVLTAADAFIAECGALIRSRSPAGESFYRSHEQLIASVAELTRFTIESGAAQEAADEQQRSARIRHSVTLLAVALAVAILGAIIIIRSVTVMFHRQHWQALELAQLSSRAMSDQEETARRFSRELHDEFGQALNAIEANLVSMHHARAYNAGRMEDCLGLIKDAIGNLREISQLLRPSILDDFGLDASLRWLADNITERTGIRVHYESDYSARLPEQLETNLFRIAQEALTNVQRHSGATEVRLRLKNDAGGLTMTVSDNGKGFTAAQEHKGLGLVGMRARSRAANGVLRIHPNPGKGVTVEVKVPATAFTHEEDSHPVGR